MNNIQSNKINYKIVIIAILAFILIYFGGKFGLNYFYSHDSNATVANEVVFDSNFSNINVSSIEFQVPTNIYVDNNNYYFTMDDVNQKYVIRVDIQESDFQYLLNNYKRIKADTAAPYNSKPIIKNYNGKDYIVIETAKRFSKTLAAFTKVSDDKILFITIINKKNTYDYQLLEKFSSIINTATIKNN